MHAHAELPQENTLNDTLNTVAIATLSAPVSLRQKKQISPFVTSKVRQRVLLGTDVHVVQFKTKTGNY